MKICSKLTEKLRKKQFFLVLFSIFVCLPFSAHSFDRDLDNDGFSDSQFGGMDRDLDNDGFSDAQSGGMDRDLDNDGFSDSQFGGMDRDLDNDGFSDGAN